MRKHYRFHKKKTRNINVTFSHIPGKWFSTGTRDMGEAVRWAEEKLRNDMIGTSGLQKPKTLREFADGLFTPADPIGLKMRNIRRNRDYLPVYYEAHQARLENYILPEFGNFLNSEITDVAIEDWFVSLPRFNDSAIQLADNSKNKILDCFRIVLQEAKRLRLIDANPAMTVRLITARSKIREPFHDLELYKMFPQDEEKLLHIWGGQMWTTYFLIMRDTGFRPGEVAALCPHNYNRERQGLYTDSSIHYITREIQHRIKTTGKGKGYKVGLLTEQTIKQLEKHIKKTAPKAQNLIMQINGRAIIPEVANKHLKASLKRAKVDIKDRTQYCVPRQLKFPGYLQT